MLDNRFLEQTHRTCANHIPKARRCYIALSGGLDSTCLLHMVHAWCKQHQLLGRVVAVHIDHQLHADSGIWRDHCQRITEHLQIPLQLITVSVEQRGKGLECAAREARWDVFKSLMSSSDILLLGHHLNDQVETGLYRMLRGTGLGGIQGMRDQCYLFERLVLRPLLHWQRSNLVAYAAAHGLKHVEDPSNQSQRFDRNYIRHGLLPALQSRWPRALESLGRTMAHLQSDWDLLSAYAEQELSQLRVEVCGLSGLCWHRLSKFDRAKQKLMLRLSIAERGWYLPTAAQMDEFVSQVNQAKPDQRIRLQNKQWVMVLSVKTLFLYPATFFTSESVTSGNKGSRSAKIIITCPNPVSIDASEALGATKLSVSMRWVFRVALTSRTLDQYNRLLLKHRIPFFMRDYMPCIQCDDGRLFFPKVTVLDHDDRPSAS